MLQINSICNGATNPPAVLIPTKAENVFTLPTLTVIVPEAASVAVIARALL